VYYTTNLGNARSIAQIGILGELNPVFTATYISHNGGAPSIVRKKGSVYLVHDATIRRWASAVQGHIPN